MPEHRYADRIAQALSQIKDEDEVWGEITAASCAWLAAPILALK